MTVRVPLILIYGPVLIIAGVVWVWLIYNLLNWIEEQVVEPWLNRRYEEKKARIIERYEEEFARSDQLCEHDNGKEEDGSEEGPSVQGGS